MNARVAALLVAVLVVLGGGALFLQRREAAQAPAALAPAPRLLKGLQAADVASIRIAQPKAALTLQRKDAGWTIAERDGFPADAGKVRDFLLKVVELKAAESEPIADKDRARLELDGSGTELDFGGAQGKPLARLLVGKKYFSREVEDPAKAPGDGRFVLLPDSPSTVYLVSDPLSAASAKSADWIDRTGLKIEKVKSLEVRLPGGDGYRIERSGDNADWKLAGAKPGEKLDVSKANAASYMLSELELADVAAPGQPDTGLDQPARIRATTLGGATYDIQVGGLVGENYYLSFKTSGSDAREQLLQNYVLLVPKSKLDDTLKPRAEMLAKKQDTKK